MRLFLPLCFNAKNNCNNTTRSGVTNGKLIISLYLLLFGGSCCILLTETVAFTISTTITSRTTVSSVSSLKTILYNANKKDSIISSQQKQQQSSLSNSTTVTTKRKRKRELVQRVLQSLLPNRNTKLIRGRGYDDNSTSILSTDEVARQLGVKPVNTNSTVQKWKRAWNVGALMVPIFHWRDKCQLLDTNVNLHCLWWKALAGNDATSPAYDSGLSYDVLPSISRWVVHPKMIRFYPRFHHANVELRTTFLDTVLTDIIKEQHRNSKIRLLSFGAGYDLRSVKFLERNLIDKAIELDLPHIIQAKTRILSPNQRLCRRRPWLLQTLNNTTTSTFTNSTMLDDALTLVPVDLNNVTLVQEILQNVLTTSTTTDDTNTNEQCYYTIILFEGVMIYLQNGVPSSLLNVTSRVLRDNNNTLGSLLFADRLENVPGGDSTLATHELKRNGWKLCKWMPKPGLARHMGSANLL